MVAGEAIVGILLAVTFLAGIPSFTRLLTGRDELPFYRGVGRLAVHRGLCRDRLDPDPDSGPRRRLTGLRRHDSSDTDFSAAFRDRLSASSASESKAARRWATRSSVTENPLIAGDCRAVGLRDRSLRRSAAAVPLSHRTRCIDIDRELAADDELFNSQTTARAWTFPVLAKYRFGHGGLLSPYVMAGASFGKLTSISQVTNFVTGTSTSTDTPIVAYRAPAIPALPSARGLEFKIRLPARRARDPLHPLGYQ